MEGAGPVEVSLNDIVITLWRDLLPIFKPVDLWKKTRIAAVHDPSRFRCVAVPDLQWALLNC